MNNLPTFFIEIDWKEFQQQHPGKGIVIHGPQGSGKTTLAKKIVHQFQSYWMYNYADCKDQFEEFFSMADWGIQAILIDAVIDTDSLMLFADGITKRNNLFIFCIQGEPGPVLRGPFVFIDAVSKVVTDGQETETQV